MLKVVLNVDGGAPMGIKEKITIIWLGGLISTDGVVKNQTKNKIPLSYCLYSKEKDWLKLVLRRINEIGLYATIRNHTTCSFSKDPMYALWLFNPRKITLLFNKYNLKNFFNPRKWKLINMAMDHYKNNKGKPIYTKWEDEIIKKNIHLSNKKIANLLKNRDKMSVAHRKWRLGLKKQTQGGGK